MAQTTCRECNAHYNSERELRDHLGAVHRGFGSEQVSSQPDNTESELPTAPAEQPAK